jgi:hypothetical protein
MNTSSIFGTLGSLDFQFKPGPLITQAATVQITNFSGGTSVGAPQTIGDVTGGPLPAAFTINNTNVVNDYFQSFTYGNSLSFDLTFSGPAVTSPNGQSTSTSEFTFSTFSDQAGVNTRAHTRSERYLGHGRSEPEWVVDHQRGLAANSVSSRARYPMAALAELLERLRV